jgi:hypothetical protein
MIETIGGGILGSLIGGLFRLAPEAVKYFDRKDERKHELAMFDRQCELEKSRGEIKLSEINAQRDATIDAGVIQAMQSAVEQQTEMTKSASGWVASLSASVRPVVTYCVLAIWSFIHAWFALSSWQSGLPSSEVFKLMMSADFSALVAGTLNYWFLDRTLAKRGL